MAEARVLVDSSVWVYLLRAGAPQALVEQVAGLTRQGRTVCSGPIRLELIRGARNEASARVLRDQLSVLPMLEVPETAWGEAGDIGFKIARKGASVAGMDLLIAALAIHHHCRLLHLDTDFDRIARFAPLTLETPAWRPG